jgi:acid phosphatase (class A)
MLRALAFAGLVVLSSAASAQPAQQLHPAPASVQPNLDSVALLDGPPPPLSAAQAADTLAMHPVVSPDRLARARTDQAFDPFVELAPVFGGDFTAARLPRTRRLYDEITAVLIADFAAAKIHWQRRRPFLENLQVLQCDQPTPEFAASGSYPSGHSAAGWAWALVTAQMAPSRADALLRRGFDFGQSRVICGVHYQSDVDAGRILGAAALARMQADAGFRRDVDAARAELTRAYPASR